jgi:hypothetical protein
MRKNVQKFSITDQSSNANGYTNEFKIIAEIPLR